MRSQQQKSCLSILDYLKKEGIETVLTLEIVTDYHG